MADTFTPNYNLVLPGIGGDVNTWGTLLNGNFTAIDTAMFANLDTAGTRSMTGNLKVKKANPAVALIDTSQVLPAGAWQWESTGNVFELLRNTAAAGDFSTSTTPISVSAADGVSLLGALAVGTTLSVGTNLSVGGTVTVTGQTTLNNSVNLPNGVGLFSKNQAGTATIQLIKLGSDNNMDVQLVTGAAFRVLNQAYTVALLNCDSNGNLSVTGNITAFSDERVKCDWKAAPRDLVEMAAQATVGTYTQKITGARQAGGIAQEWLSILEGIVGTDADSGLYTMAYGNAAFVLACELAKRLLALEALVRDELK